MRPLIEVKGGLKRVEQTQTFSWVTPKNHFLAGIDMNNWLRQLFTPRDRQSRDSIIGFFFLSFKKFHEHMLLCLHSCCLRDAKYAFYLFDYFCDFASMAACGSQFTCPSVHWEVV